MSFETAQRPLMDKKPRRLHFNGVEVFLERLRVPTGEIARSSFLEKKTIATEVTRRLNVRTLMMIHSIEACATIKDNLLPFLRHFNIVL